MSLHVRPNWRFVFLLFSTSNSNRSWANRKYEIESCSRWSFRNCNLWNATIASIDGEHVARTWSHVIVTLRLSHGCERAGGVFAHRRRIRWLSTQMMFRFYIVNVAEIPQRCNAIWCKRCIDAKRRCIHSIFHSLCRSACNRCVRQLKFRPHVHTKTKAKTPKRRVECVASLSQPQM